MAGDYIRLMLALPSSCIIWGHHSYSCLRTVTMKNSETNVMSTTGVKQSVASYLKITLDAILKPSNIVGPPSPACLC